MTGITTCYRNPSDDENVRKELLEDCKRIKTWVGHNILGYDLPAMVQLLGTINPPIDDVVDTFIASKLIDFSRSGHGVEDYGIDFGIEKISFSDFSKYSPEMEEYCIRDVQITELIYKKYKKYIDNPIHRKSIVLESYFYVLCKDMSTKGFLLDTIRVNKLLHKVLSELQLLDKDILDTFTPKLKLIREITPKETQYGTINLSSIPKSLRDTVSEYSVGAPFCHCHWVAFNPGSPTQIVSLLNEAGWKPTDKTKTHIETERDVRRFSRARQEVDSVALTLLRAKLKKLEISGWKVNENNLSTLPPSAPAGARLLARRILYESRRKTLVEWSGLVDDTSRVHGQFQSIGAWTHRMSHQKPNMANVTNEFDLENRPRLLGKELRQCWTVPKDRLLVGVDADGIQLRIFAHYINDPEFIYALVHGRKDDKSDPHSLNQRILGSPCRSRAAAKRFVFAFLLGGAIGKLSEILGCGESEGKEALDRLYGRYTGLQTLKDTIIPTDASRGWFSGLDGRKVRILGDTRSERKHRAMSGYLQNGEAVVVKTACIIAEPEIKKLDSFFVDIIHDEAQIETPNDFKIALRVAQIMDEAITEAGRVLGTLCPLKGSYMNDHKEYTIGRNWYQTH